MKSQNITYISRLDHLRFFAFVFVFFFHFQGDISSFPQGLSSLKEIITLFVHNGSSGVALFLVLSGFLFCIICQGGERKINYLPFIYNRILRIFPLLIFLFFIIIAIDRPNSTPMDVLRLVTLQLNTGHPWTGWAHSDAFPTGPIWTIAVEFQFYLIFPIIISFTQEKGMSWLWLIVLLMVVTRALVVGNNTPELYYHFYHTIIGRLDQFIIGIIAGIFYLKNSEKLKHILLIIFCCFFIFISFCLLFMQAKNSWFSATLGFTLEGILWSSIIIIYLSIPFPNFKKLSRFLAWLGSMSFSMYLFHMPIIFFILKLNWLTPPHSLKDLLLKTIVILPMIILFSTLTYYTIEKPFFNKRVKYLQ